MCSIALSLAIPPWVGAMSTSECWDVNRHTARCTSPVSVVWQCKLVSGWLRANETETSAALWALWLGEDFTLLYLPAQLASGRWAVRRLCQTSGVRRWVWEVSLRRHSAHRARTRPTTPPGSLPPPTAAQPSIMHMHHLLLNNNETNTWIWWNK